MFGPNADNLLGKIQKGSEIENEELTIDPELASVLEKYKKSEDFENFRKSQEDDSKI